MAGSRTFSVKITGDARDLKRAFGDAETSAQRFDQSLVNFGKKGALALAGVAAASTKLASDFENSMSKMVGLVGLADSEVDGFKDSILALSGETAKAPQELADAMFFITSAGLRGSDALDALEASAKGSAAGLGDTQSVALAAVSAVNAYGKENLNASQAVDILANTIRQGNVEASEVASTLGQVIPVAAELGIGFDEVGASIAAMTRLGSNAAESTTALSSIMSALVKPTADAEQKLSEVGLSVAELREQAGSGGLLPVLNSLKTAFGGNVEAMGAVFGNVRALRGVMALTGESADVTKGIFAELANSTGVLGEAFGAVADDEGFKLQQAFNDIKVILTEVGEDVLPQLAGVLSDNREEIGDTVQSVGDLTVSMVELIAALEPVIGFLPTIGDGANIVANSFINVGAGLAAATAEIFTFGQANTEGLQAAANNAAANNDLWNALRNVEKWMGEGKDATLSYSDSIADLADKGTLTEGALEDIADATEITEERQKDALRTLIAWSEENGVAADQILILKAALNEFGDSVVGANTEANNFEARLAGIGSVARTSTPDVDAYGNAIGGIGDGAEGIKDVTAAIKAQQTEIRKAIDPVFALREAQDKAVEAMDAFKTAAEEGKTPQEDLNDLAADAASAQADLEFAYQNARGQIEEGSTLIEEYGTRAGLSAEAVKLLTRETNLLADAMGRLQSVTFSGDPTHTPGRLDDPARLRELEEELRRRARGEA